MKSFDATRVDFAPYGLTCELWTQSPMTRADRHNEIELNLLLHGTLTYLLGGDRFTIEAGTLASFWAAIPHQILPPEQPGRPAEYFVVTIPLAWFLQLRLPECFCESIMHGEVVMEQDAIRFNDDSKLFSRWAHDLSSPGSVQHRAAVLELEARLLRFGLAMAERNQISPQASHRSQAVAAGSTGKAEQMARYIAQNYTSSMSINDVSTAVGLHPGYAMTLFRKAFGMSIVTCINEHRLTHAKRLLTTTSEQIVTIAFECGFGSLSRFNDAFRRTIGCTPRQFRNKHQASSDVKSLVHDIE